MKTLAISPCPNDTFGFFPLISGIIPSPEPLKASFFDIETLNRLALQYRYDVIKMSAATFAYCTSQYKLMPTGNAFALTTGPLVIARSHINPKKVRLAIPGKNTTAFILFKLLYGEPLDFLETPYHMIPELVLRGIVDAGIIIHESRFILTHTNLKIVADLGEEYYKRFQEPFPLGVIGAKSDSLKHSIASSFATAKKDPSKVLPFTQRFAQEKRLTVIKKHINTYVTKETYALNDDAIQAMRNFYKRGIEVGLFPKESINFEIV